MGEDERGMRDGIEWKRSMVINKLQPLPPFDLLQIWEIIGEIMAEIRFLIFEVRICNFKA